MAATLLLPVSEQRPVEAMADRLCSAMDGAGLTRHQQIILLLTALGYTERPICEALKITTIRAVSSYIRRRLGLSGSLDGRVNPRVGMGLWVATAALAGEPPAPASVARLHLRAAMQFALVARLGWRMEALQ